MRALLEYLGDVVKHLKLRLCKVHGQRFGSLFLRLALQLAPALAVPMSFTQEILGPAWLLIAPPLV